MGRRRSAARQGLEPRTERELREVMSTCGSFHLRRASRVVTQLYDAFLQPTGLRSTQLVVLVVLAVEGEIALSRLAKKLVISPSTLWRNLIPLERDQYVETRLGERRGRFVALTEQGEEALKNALPHWQRAQKRFVELVGDDAWLELSTRLGNAVTAARDG